MTVSSNGQIEIKGLNQHEIDLFKALLDTLIAMTQLEEDEQNFINRLYEALI